MSLRAGGRQWLIKYNLNTNPLIERMYKKRYLWGRGLLERTFSGRVVEQ